MATSTSTPRMPQELCEKVVASVTVENDPAVDIDLQDRYFTLRQCALVCKAWLPSVRARIFHTVQLSRSEASRLLDLLTLNPAIARYMAHVIVRGLSDYNDSPLELLAELAPKLTAVETLTIDYGQNKPDSYWFWDSEYGGLDPEQMKEFQNAILPMLQAPTLKTVILRAVAFTTKEQLYNFICGPSVFTLILDDNVNLSPKSDWLSDAGGLMQSTRRLPAISELGLHSEDATLSRWLLHRSCPVNISALRGLSIRLNDVGNMCDFLPLLSAIGSSLKEFGVRLPDRCDFKEYRRFSEIIDAIPTLPNTHIEHIFVSGFDRRDPSIGGYSKHFDGAEFVKSLLLRLPVPQRLKEVTIDEAVQILWRRDKEFPKLQWHNWRAVDEVLAQNSFSNVTQLHFFSRLHRLELQRDVRSCIAPQFPTFQKRKGKVFNLTVEYSNWAWSRAQAQRDDYDYPINSGDV
ncbi:hypothetical protein C8R43DRAFT_1007603 [Mycena crocata]|nr:hypothetical protein C8R43DRAFT_1007603 [Mycena crocata]